MSLVDKVVTHVPEPFRGVLMRHRELAKFLIVGGTAYAVDTAFFVGLKTTVLQEKVITAKLVAILVATIVSYVLNREWSFRTRGGRETHHEAALFFVLNGIGTLITLAPLWTSHYLIGIQTPEYSRLTENIADFVSAQVIGTALGLIFRFWAYRKFVFPQENARPRIRVVRDEEDRAA